MSRIVAVAFAMLIAGNAPGAALTIDTNPTYSGAINSGWAGSGQSLYVDAVQSHLDDISFYFAKASNKKSFTLSIVDALVGGATLFSSSFTVQTGINTLVTNLDLTANSTVFALIDYNGFKGQTAHFSTIDGYAGGSSLFYSGGSWSAWSSLDHRFIAHFSPPLVVEPPVVSGVPLPASGLALLAGLGGVAALRRARKGAGTGSEPA